MLTSNLFVLGIDASRAKSGGGKSHLVGIISEMSPERYGFSHVHLWVPKEIGSLLPKKPWLTIHSPKELELNIFHQLVWQKFALPKELKRHSCDILLTADASSLCNFHPNIVMSRDMLSFEKGEIERYGISFARIRLILIKYLQIFSLKRAEGAIFLTKYASDVIQSFTGVLHNYEVIPHGVSKNFKRSFSELKDEQKEINCVYVSNTDFYKHQWHVVRAVYILRNANYNIKLNLIGGGAGEPQKILDKCLFELDPQREFVTCTDKIPHIQLPIYLANADIFIFASSCENMPNTLIEGMAYKLPIVCSNRGPMPEVLKDAGLYFDPEDHQSIASTLEVLIKNSDLRTSLASKAFSYAENYSWNRCANETMNFIKKTLLIYKTKTSSES